MTTVSVQRYRGGVLTSATSAVLTVYDSIGGTAAGPTTVTPTSAGVYSYDIPHLAAGIYTAQWVFSVTGEPDDTIERIFEADEPFQIITGVTLMDIEQKLARCVGPYRRYKSGTLSAVESIHIPRLKSTIDTGGLLENMFVLRRGLMYDGSYISGFNENDRYRQVASMDHATGLVTVDEPYTIAPTNLEMIEFHYLDPEQELRIAVLDGLERCFFWDQAVATLTDATRETNLTTLFPQIDEVSQIRNVQFQQTSVNVPSHNLAWFQPYLRNGSVYLNTEWLGPSSLIIDYLRKVSSYVNGELSLTGPNSDTDVLNVNLDYAVLSGWVQCWVQFTDRMISSAAQGSRLTPDMVSKMFTNRSQAVYNSGPPDRALIRYDATDALTQVGNAAEANV